MGVSLNKEKTGIGPEMAALGLLGKSQCPGNEMRIEIALTEEKKAKWANLIDLYFKLGVIAHEKFGILMGKLSFSNASISGGFGRPFPPLVVGPRI